MEEKCGQELQLETPSLLSIGPFLGSCSSQEKANKENRSMNSSCLPQKLLAVPAGVWLCLCWAPQPIWQVLLALQTCKFSWNHGMAKLSESSHGEPQDVLRT